jgi:hypothetical protein
MDLALLEARDLLQYRPGRKLSLKVFARDADFKG